MSKAKKIAKKSGRIFFYVAVGILAFVLLLFLFLNTRPGKNVVRTQVQNYLERKLKTKVEIGTVNYSLPQWLELKDVYFEDQNKDTLFFGKELSVDLNMYKLLMGNTDIQKVYLNNIFANIYRNEKDSFFNYQYIIDAFTGNKPSTKIKDTAELKLTLKNLILDTVALRFNDKNTGSLFYARINNLNTSIEKFQPERLYFGLNEFYAKGVFFNMLTYKAPVADTTVKVFSDSALAEPTLGLYITAKKFNLQNILVDVKDTISKFVYFNDVKNLLLTSATYNHEQSVAMADTAWLDSSLIKFVQPKATVKDEKIVVSSKGAMEKPPLYIKAGNLRILESQIQYNNLGAPKQDGFDAAHVDAEKINVQVLNLLYSKDSSAAFVKQLAFRDKSGLRVDSTTADLVFTDTLLQATTFYIRTPNSILQDYFSLRYDSVAGITKYPQNTLIEAKLRNSTIAFRDLYILFPFLKQSFPPKEFAGNNVRFNTELRGNLSRLYLPYLQMNGLSGSNLQARGTLYNLTDAKRFSYDLYIINSRIRKSDMMKFVPIENRGSLASLPDIINLSGRLSGDKNKLLANINASSKDLNYKGLVTLNNISNPSKLDYGLSFDNVGLSKKFIEGYFTPEVKSMIALPEMLNAQGKFKGNINDFDADLKLKTSYGNGTLKGWMKGFKNPQTARYDLTFNSPGFDLGKLLKQDTSIGSMSGSVALKGTGFDYKTMNADIAARLNSIAYNRYHYKNVDIDAVLRNGLITSRGTINDPNLRVAYDIAANIRNRYPTITGYVDVDTARLRQLGFTEDTLNMSFLANLQAKNTTPRQLDVSVIVDTLKFQSGINRFVLDALSLTGTSQNGEDDIALQTPFAYAHAKGSFDYDKIGTAVAQYINGYYKINPSLKPKPLPDQDVNFEAYIARHPLMTSLVPGLQDYDSIDIKGRYTSNWGDSALFLKADIPYVLYNGNILRRGEIDINAKNEKINYYITFDTLMAGGRKFFGSKIHGAAAKDSISFSAITEDNFGKEWFGANADFYYSEGTYALKLKNNLLLNYERWDVAADNAIQYSPQKGILVNNFRINSDTSIIEINSMQPVFNTPIEVNIDNFNLRSITSFLNQDTLLVSGIVDAQMEVSDFNKNIPAFTGTAQITNLEVKEEPLGTLALYTQKVNDNTITGRASLNGYGNIIEAGGNYYLNNTQQQFDADLNIVKLNFKTVQGVSFGELKDASGNMHGNIKMNGKFSDPRWYGSLVFDTTKFTITQLGAPYKIDNQTISFNYPKVQFDFFTIQDSLGNKLRVNGDIISKSLDNYGLSLSITADDFMVMNAKKAIANTIYGFASVDANLAITGNSEVPRINGNIRVNENSNIKMVLPDRNYAKDEGLSVVKFIDRDTFDIYHPPLFSEKKEPKAMFGRFLNYSLDIEMTKDARMTIIVDPTTGDQLEVQGTANLNAGVDPGGNLILAGTYTLEEGTYDLSYQFINRKFNLRQGSTLIFAGDPMQAQADISADYIVQTNSRNLIGNQVTENNPLMGQTIPFRVTMDINGTITRPSLKFGIELIEEESGAIDNELRTTIVNKLAQIENDEAAINKQVFSLLLMARFTNERSSDFFAGNGVDFGDIARQSVTQFLSQALDEIAADLIKGVDIDLSLNSYRDFSLADNGTQRTDLNVSLSKNFMNDRLTVTIGQSFGIEGQDAVSRANIGNNNSVFNPNISVGYKLTPDGKYRLKAYRKNQFEVALDGYVVETGLSFVVVMDYEKFREIFGRKKK